MLLQSDLQRLCSCQPEARGTRSTDAKKCPFCRHVLPKSKQQVYKNYLAKRAEANDPAALYRLGMKRFREGNYPAAFEYYSKAHYELSVMYQGQGIDVDEKKSLHHSEEAAIGGHPIARYNLGCNEMANGRYDRAVKHWIIAASLGEEDSLENMKLAYQDGFISRDDLAAALRAYQATIDDMKSPQRDEAEEHIDRKSVSNY